MHEIDYTYSFTFKPKSRLGKKISCSALNGTLENAGSYQLVTPPLAGEGVLTDDVDHVRQLTPWGVLLHDLRTLPTN